MVARVQEPGEAGFVMSFMSRMGAGQVIMALVVLTSKWASDGC